MVPVGQAREPSALLTATASVPTGKMAGENGPTVTAVGCEEPAEVLTTTFTVCVVFGGTIFHGTCTLSCCPGAMVSRRGASRVVSPLTNSTVTPPSEVDNGIVSACCRLVAM